MCGIFAYLSNKTSLSKLVDTFLSINHRGPDNFTLFKYKKYSIGFHRLAINGLDKSSNQPIYLEPDLFIIANAEIYNYKYLSEINNIKLNTNSDCEIILHLYKRFGINKTLLMLDGVFSFMIFDKDTVYVARDPIGVRPLFMGTVDENEYCFASEMKAIHKTSENIIPFQPGTYACIQNGQLSQKTYFPNMFVLYNLVYIKYLTDSCVLDTIVDISNLNYNECLKNINILMESAVNKRLLSNREIGCFLSGGFDSSIVTSIASKSIQNLKTFSIGLKGHHSPDLVAADIVAKYLNTDHHTVEYTIEEGLSAIKETIKSLESYDVTTIRASVPQYLLSKYVKENTDVTVVLSGEGADEICGYQYLKNAPSKDEFINETTRMLKDLYQYDVLRTDRVTSKWSLEVRVPFLDKAFLQFMMSIDPKYKMCNNTIEKKIFRDAFDNGEYLPKEILWRNKNAFSDAVSYSWVDKLKEHIDNEVSDIEYHTERVKYSHNMPYDKESYYYRKIFEEYYPGQSKLISKFWMPNQEWFKDTITDPSARVLECFDDTGDNKL